MAACSFQAQPIPGGGGGGDDDQVDGGAVVMGCAWAAHFDACELPTPPGQPLVLNGPTRWTFSTLGSGAFGPMVPSGGFVTRSLSQNGGGRQVLVLYTSAFTLGAGATLTVTGDKPLVIAADSTIEIDGDLDAGSHAGGAGPSVIGPGANDIGCTGVLTGGTTGGGGNGGGGGGGGALAAAGGSGGASNGGGAGGNPGLLVGLPAFVRAGCAGGIGGTKDGGRGGTGGGVIELAARGAITVMGRINAGGAGGAGGGKQQGGGGGGGSGGIISFHAPMVTLAVNAVVAANGGGGGAGASDEGNGNTGDDGPLAATSAQGGEPGTDRAGGEGGAAAVLIGSTGATSDNGGGGGGGSVGFVMVRASMFSAARAVVSPPAMPF